MGVIVTNNPVTEHDNECPAENMLFCSFSSWTLIERWHTNRMCGGDRPSPKSWGVRGGHVVCGCEAGQHSVDGGQVALASTLLLQKLSANKYNIPDIFREHHISRVDINSDWAHHTCRTLDVQSRAISDLNKSTGRLWPHATRKNEITTLQRYLNT